MPLDNNLQMFCLTMNPKHLKLIQKLNYIPVGLGKMNFSSDFITDKNGDNISAKNDFYGEYTFHYWLWKNKEINFSSWIGFCQYRKFWLKNTLDFKKYSFNEFSNSLLKKIPKKFNEHEVILTKEIYINQFRFSKFVKNNLKKMIKNPSLFFFKKKRTIKVHFDMMHGEGNLNKAIKLLHQKDRSDFEYFVNKEVSFNSQNMFICKNKNILFDYYESVFPWLINCEKVFGFKNLDSYGLKRIYAFLAERYLSFWFKKYTKYTTMQFIFKDIGEFL